MENNFNWQSEHLGKKVINENGRIGEFVARYDYPSFIVEYENGEKVDAAIGSPMGTGWKLAEEEQIDETSIKESSQGEDVNLALRDGQRIRRPNWEKNSYWELSKDGYERILYSDGTPAKVHLKQLEENDWEIYKEEQIDETSIKESPSKFLKRLGIDGQKWAEEFMKLFGDNKERIDEGLMIGWFCNSIMAGMDEQAKRIKDKLEKIL